jgi:adenosylhomocysteinase
MKKMHRNDERIEIFFKSIVSSIKISKRDFSVVLVTHILPDRDFFLNAIEKITKSFYIIPKPKSINKTAFNRIQSKYNFLYITKEQLLSKKFSKKTIKEINGNVVILDMGGYFAKSINYLSINCNVLGVVEDSENGHQKYLKETPINLPILSVARSSLKEPEDYLVGQSVVFSTESVLRDQNIVLNNKNIGILGYGKIGRSIARTLANKNLQTFIYDIDPIKRIQAISHGFSSPEKKELLKNSDILICSTGNKALLKSDYKYIKNGCCISSVTSSDDELDLSTTREFYSIKEISNNVQLFENGKNYFYLLYNGNAINFLHNAAVGSFIYLVQAEIIACMGEILSGKAERNGYIKQLSDDSRKKIANLWLKHFIY